jgi:hypothetical protein
MDCSTMKQLQRLPDDDDDDDDFVSIAETTAKTSCRRIVQTASSTSMTRSRFYDHQRDDQIEGEKMDCPMAKSTTTTTTTRRTTMLQMTMALLASVAVGHTSLMSSYSSAAAAVAADHDNIDTFETLFDNPQFLKSLRYKRELGAGAFKSVYEVEYQADATVTSPPPRQKKSIAMAVERLRFKSEANDELRGIRITEHIQTTLRQSPSTSHDGKYFESVLDWWIQRSSLAPFKIGQTIFSGTTVELPKRTKSRPSSFVGKPVFLVSFKPLYDMDLRTFANEATAMYAVTQRNIPQSNDASTTVGGIELSDKGALKLVYELCHIGRVLHDTLGIVHRDIKPKVGG